MTDERLNMFRNRLMKVWRHLSRQAKRSGITCFRVYDHDLPEYPLCIERYENNLYVAEYKRRHGLTDNEHDQWMEKSLEVIREVLEVDNDHIFLKLRQRKPGRLGQYQKMAGEQHEFEVQEGGLKFIVNLTDYLDTGLFLDHRITRDLVREKSSGKKILNLFAYTGSFSVYAASGGADEVITVDLSKTYLSWAERNLKLNGFKDANQFKIVHADVLQYLRNIPKEYFDIIIMDPPTFSNSKRMEDFLDIQRDHLQLIQQCLSGLKAGGQLYFSTNLRTFKLDPSLMALSKDITKATTPFDFEGKFSRYCYLFKK